MLREGVRCLGGVGRRRFPALRRGYRTMASSPPNHHLFVLVHGLQGQPGDLACLKEALLASSSRPSVHLSTCNTERTDDGVASGGLRLAEELRAVVAATPRATHLSVVGNSLGGLYARYALPLLHDDATSTVCGLVPATFLTTATPHLGVGAYGHLSLIPRPLQRASSLVLGKTVRELLLCDAKPQLLLRMATEARYLRALACFQRRILYANAVNDALVSYETASISADRVPPPRLLRRVPHVLFTRTRPVVEPAAVPPPPAIAAGGRQGSGARLAAQRLMAAGLCSLSWTETAVCFPGALPIAHNKIVSLRRDGMSWLYKEGQEIVAHTAAALLQGLEDDVSAREAPRPAHVLSAL